jgi:hypothetical protein
MRNISLSVAALLAGAVVALGALGACGPSGKQIATAKQARYQGDRLQLFATMKAAVESKYKIMKSDEASMGLQTDGRWYNPEGQAVSATMDDVRDVPDQSINVSLVVELLPEGQSFVVAIKPVFLRYHKGRPNPDVLDAKDPSIPGWAHGKGDNLAVEIYDAMKQYEVKAAPAAPAPAPAAPAPAAGSGTEPPAEPPPAPAPAPAPTPAPAP